jgi:hypothetical protein
MVRRRTQVEGLEREQVCYKASSSALFPASAMMQRLSEQFGLLNRLYFLMSSGNLRSSKRGIDGTERLKFCMGRRGSVDDPYGMAAGS